MAGGRPTEYSPATLKKAKEYLATCEDEELERGSDIRPLYKIRVKLPTIEGLAVYLGVSRDTIYEWENVHEEFSDILASLRAEQADKLINNGLSGDYNPTIAKVLLTKHGYREGIEQTGKDGEPLMNDETKKKSKTAIASFLNRGNS